MTLEVENIPIGETMSFESSALNGLRGFAAVHILIYHSVLYSSWGFQIYGQVHMPLFFLLSGFCMTLGYGKKKYNSSTICCGPCKAASGCDCRPCKSLNDSNQEIFDSIDFYLSRFARILPVYYFCIIIGGILIPFGHGGFAPDNLWFNVGGSVLSLFLLQTWVLVFGFGPNGPSWTVSTLFFFYLVYPSLLVFAQKRSNHILTILMALSFYSQVILSCLVFHDIFSDGVIKYWIGTAHPLVRLPVFFMGVCAGVLCIRIQQGDLDAFHRFGRWANNGFLSFIEDSHLPFPFCQQINESSSVNAKKRSWQRRVDINMAFYLSLLIVFTIMNIYYVSLMASVKSENDGDKCQVFMDENGGWSWKNQTAIETMDQSNDTINNEQEYFENHSIPCLIFVHALPGMYLQVTACYLQLMIIVGLCLDAGKSLTCRFFKTRAMQFLGRISMSLYLIHEPLIYWIKFIVHGQAEWMDGKNPGLTMPIWAIPIHVLISLVFGTLLTIFLEEPARKFLKNILAKRKEAENIQTAQSQLELP